MYNARIMNSLKQKEPIILLIGDTVFLLLSLWLSLVIRNLSVPTKSIFYIHLVPFGYLFIAWIVVFYIAGLYEKRTLILRSRLPGLLFSTQVANSLIAVLFFYLIPVFGIAPKTLLFIYLLVSSLIMIVWRAYGYFLIGSTTTDNALIIGSGKEMDELIEEVNQHSLYKLKFVSSVDLQQAADVEKILGEAVEKVSNKEISLIVADLAHTKADAVIPRLYSMIFDNVVFVDMHKMYEDIFKRVPLSLLKYNWFLENISAYSSFAYDALKRLMDIVVSIVLLIITLPFDVFAIVMIRLEDKGSAFIVQERLGKNNTIIRIYKFRTMTTNDDGKYDDEKATTNKITKIGSFLRKSRIDEFPQFFNVIKGDLSLVGPRPELPLLAKLYEKEIPYYNIRHIIKPGLSGWAQIYQENHPHHKEAISETEEKLAYDLYYIKNRSLLLDIKIALRTIRTLLSRAGR